MGSPTFDIPNGYEVWYLCRGLCGTNAYYNVRQVFEIVTVSVLVSSHNSYEHEFINQYELPPSWYTAVKLHATYGTRSCSRPPYCFIYSYDLNKCVFIVSRHGVFMSRTISFLRNRKIKFKNTKRKPNETLKMGSTTFSTTIISWIRFKRIVIRLWFTCFFYDIL